jgi:hypothetical protein
MLEAMVPRDTVDPGRTLELEFEVTGATGSYVLIHGVVIGWEPRRLAA